MASIEERRQNVKKQLKEIYEAYEEAKEDIELEIDSLKDNFRDSGLMECNIKVLEMELGKLRNSDDASSNELEKNNEPQEDSIPKENSDDSSEVEISTVSQNHQGTDQRQKSDGAKKRRRDESENLERDQVIFSFGKKKRSRHDAGSNVPAFDDEDAKIIELMREMSKLFTERQVERLKWFPPTMKRQLLSWLGMTQNM